MEKKISICTTKSTISLFLDHTTKICIDSSKILSPIPFLDYIHKVKENDIIQDIQKLLNNEKNMYQSIHLLKFERFFTKKNVQVFKVTTRMKSQNQNYTPDHSIRFITVCQWDRIYSKGINQITTKRTNHICNFWFKVEFSVHRETI